MANPFKDSSPLYIYQNKSKLKWIVLVVAALISIGSIYYTNILVEQLKETERRFISLFARSLENTINQDANLTFLTQEIIAPNTSIPVIWSFAKSISGMIKTPEKSPERTFSFASSTSREAYS